MNTSSGENLLSPAFVAELKRLELTSRRKATSDLMGRYRTAFRGSGLVFSDLREYQPGDEIKNIHWKATARTNKVYVKSFDEERQLRVVLAVDVTASTDVGQSKTKHRKAFEFAALVSLLATKSKDSVGLCLFSDTIEDYIPPEQSRSQFQRIMRTLLQHRTLSSRTNIAPVLEKLASSTPRGTVVFVVSDFLSPPFEEELRLLCIRHDVILVSVEDGLDTELPSAGLVEFVDAESGKRVLVDTADSRVKAALLREHEDRIARIREIASQCGADLISMNENPLRPLADLMSRRTRRVR